MTTSCPVDRRPRMRRLPRMAPAPRRLPPPSPRPRHPPPRPRRPPPRVSQPRPRAGPDRPGAANRPASPGSGSIPLQTTGAPAPMATITAEMVRALREQSGAGMMDCKRALEETAGDVPQAIAILRERGMAAAAKKSGREAREGLIGSYIHTGGRVGALVEVNCETDFVARTDEFQRLVRDPPRPVARFAPPYVHSHPIPAPELPAQKARPAAGPGTP